MMQALFISLTLILSSLSYASENSEHQAAGAEHHMIKAKSGANLTLFPKKEQDAAKSEMPSKPKLIEPAYKAVISGDSVNLKWEKVENATVYHVQLATDPAFKWLVVDKWDLAATNLEQKGLQPATNYFWRVAAVRTSNEVGHGKGWFSVNTFSTK